MREVADADCELKAYTVPDASMLLQAFLSADLPNDSWWWQRIPARGPVRDEIDSHKHAWGGFNSVGPEWTGQHRSRVSAVMTPSRKVALATLPVASTSLLADPVFEHPGGQALLRFEFERNGAAYCGGLRFEKVRAYRFRSEGHITSWHVEGAYDTLVEVTDSEWAFELLAAESVEMRGRWEVRHFMIYIDGAGCYEIGAASWSWVQERLL